VELRIEPWHQDMHRLRTPLYMYSIITIKGVTLRIILQLRPPFLVDSMRTKTSNKLVPLWPAQFLRQLLHLPRSIILFTNQFSSFSPRCCRSSRYLRVPYLKQIKSRPETTTRRRCAHLFVIFNVLMTLF
jgi:hypothetical protein